MTKAYDRRTQKVVELPQYGGGALEFFYKNPFGRIFLRLANSHLVSNINAVRNNSKGSRRKIAEFIKKYNIKTEHSPEEFESFADFFNRTETRTVDESPNSIISPCDAKLLYYPIDDRVIHIKNTDYTIQDLTDEPLKGYENGHCLVFRLGMEDCHHYCFIDNGEVVRKKHIKGRLHTVSSISDDYKVFAQNDRIVNVLQTEKLGQIIQVEIGALLVGRIKNRNLKHFRKGEEKGHFELGGSTIVLLLPPKAKIDEDVIKYSQQGIEIKVNYGERIGKIC